MADRTSPGTITDSYKRARMGDSLRGLSKRMAPRKAKKILKHGQVGGKALSPKQKGLFGALAGQQ